MGIDGNERADQLAREASSHSQNLILHLVYLERLPER
jgi:hypothetical protein